MRRRQWRERLAFVQWLGFHQENHGRNTEDGPRKAFGDIWGVAASDAAGVFLFQSFACIFFWFLNLSVSSLWRRPEVIRVGDVPLLPVFVGVPDSMLQYHLGDPTEEYTGIQCIYIYMNTHLYIYIFARTYHTLKYIVISLSKFKPYLLRQGFQINFFLIQLYPLAAFPFQLTVGGFLRNWMGILDCYMAVLHRPLWMILLDWHHGHFAALIGDVNFAKTWNFCWIWALLK